MNVIFKDDALRELYEKGKTKDSRYKKLCRNKVFIDNYIGVIDLMVSVERTDDLRAYSYLHYENCDTGRKARSESTTGAWNAFCLPNMRTASR